MKLALGEIKENPTNPRIIKDEAFKKLVKSVKEFPEMLDARPLVLNKDHVILGGNMRFKAAKEAGIKELPVKIVDWSKEKQEEFIVKDNVSGGEWDWDELANQYEASQLEEWGLDLPQMLDTESDVEEDEAPEVSSEPPVSKLGEIYQLGRHKVMCGDSTDRASIELLMGGIKADMVLTDPPYGIDYGGMLKGKGDGRGGSDKNGWKSYDAPEWDKQKPEKVVFDNLRELAPNQIIWGGNYFTDALPPTMGWLIWDKGQRGFSLADGEMAWTSFDNALRIKEYSRASANREEKGHPTQKPQEIIKWCIDYADRHSKTKPNLILDLFLGSGSTLIACEQTDRVCYGMELDPKYVDVIRKRYWKFVNNGDETGWEEKTPVLLEGN